MVKCWKSEPKTQYFLMLKRTGSVGTTAVKIREQILLPVYWIRQRNMETQILSPSGGPPYFLWPLTWVSVVLVAFNQISRACTRSRFSTWCGNKIEPAQVHHLHVYYQVSPKYFVFSIYDMQSHKAAHPFAKFPWYRFECVHMNEVLLAASDQSHWLLYQQQGLTFKC